MFSLIKTTGRQYIYVLMLKVTYNMVKNIFLYLVLLTLFMGACQRADDPQPWQPDFIRTNLPATLSIEGGVEVELYIADAEPGAAYVWTVPQALEIVDGQQTNRIVVRGSRQGGLIPAKSIGVQGERNGEKSFTRWFYKEITILAPPPSLENYRTKRFGSKTWMIENLNEKGADGNLGWEYNNDNSKASTYGRLYSWHEAMTGISKATEADNPYTWGASGIDDAGNAYILDGTSANSFNIQVQGACPTGWHVPNVNDWYDLLVAIKTEYAIPGNTLADIGSTKDGYTVGWGREIGVVNSITLTNWGIVAPYLKGSSPVSSGGLWQGGTTFYYGGNANFPGGDYPLYKELSREIDFNILPAGRWNEGSRVFQQEGVYSYHWVAFLTTAGAHNPLRVTVGSGNANFSNGAESATNGHSLRCVANY